MRGVTVNGAEVLAARVSKGLTQDELARLTRLDAKTIRKAEQGKRLDLNPVTRLAYALKIDLQKLIVPGDAATNQQVEWRDIFMRWKRAFDECDGELMLQVYHQDAVLYLPSSPALPFGGPSRGNEAIRATHEAAWTNVRQDPTPMEDLTFLASDNGLAFRGSRRFYSFAGEPFMLHALQMMTFRDNMIFEHHVEFDTLEFMKKMGMPS